MQFLGLSQQPFSNGILAAGAIYNHVSLTQLKDTIKHHVQFSDLILLIEGNFGSGKTTLFRLLMQEQVTNTFLMPLQAEATDTLTQLQQKMSIHLKDQGDANYLDDNLKNLQVFDQTPVLMIDDAHTLSDTTLQELIRYRQQLLLEKELQLKILLFANKGMANTLEQVSDLQHSQMFVQDMPVLNAKQIQPFIHHKLALAGATQPPVLEDKTIQTIYKKSAGNPLQVMAQAVVVLEKLSKRRSWNLKPALPGGKASGLFIALLFLALLGISGYFLLQSQAPEPSLRQQAVAPPPKIAPTTPTPVTEPVAATVPEMPAAEPVLTPPPAALETTPVNETEEPALSSLADNGDSGALPETAALPPPPTEEPAEKNIPAPEKAPKTADAESQPPPVEIAVKPKPPQNKPALSKPEPEKTPAPQPQPAPTGDPSFNALAAMGIHDAEWLKQQDPNHWTMQILGARDPDTLVRFAKRHQLGDDTAWYRTDLKGQSWYVLVHRMYTDRDIARQSIARLPAGLRKSQPWVKSIASIHKAIKP